MKTAHEIKNETITVAMEKLAMLLEDARNNGEFYYSPLGLCIPVEMARQMADYGYDVNINMRANELSFISWRLATSHRRGELTYILEDGQEIHEPAEERGSQNCDMHDSPNHDELIGHSSPEQYRYATTECPQGVSCGEVMKNAYDLYDALKSLGSNPDAAATIDPAILQKILNENFAPSPANDAFQAAVKALYDICYCAYVAKNKS